MNKLSKILNYVMMIAVVASLTMMMSCGGDDEPVIVKEEGIPVADGFYITESGVDPVSSSILKDENVEDGLQSKDRDNFFANYIYLKTGSYNIVNIAAKKITETFGGTISAVTTEDAEQCETFDYSVVASALDGAAFAVSNDGLYKVTFDKQSSEIILAPITKAGLIGPATEIGWGHTSNVALAGSADATGGTWTGTDITLRQGDMKVRFNCSWKIARPDYTIFINYGADSNNPISGANVNFAVGNDSGAIPINAADGNFPNEGVYTVDVTWSAKEGFGMKLIRTGDAEELTFDPAEFLWAAMGPATDNGWDSDTQTPYLSWANGGAGGWYGNFYLTAGDDLGFKFRSDDAWTHQLNVGNTTIVSDNTADFVALGGNDQLWKLVGPSGLYYSTITTADEGANWVLSLNRVSMGVIGDATPGAWDNDTDLTTSEAGGVITFTLEGVAMTAGNFKFRMNNDWPVQVGFSNLTFTGASAGLLSDAGGDNNIKLSTAGTYDLILTTTDHGATYSLEIN